MLMVFPEEEMEETQVCNVGYEVTFCYANDPGDMSAQSVNAVTAEPERTQPAK